MKLISCKIDGFGCLVNKTYQFDGDLNSFCEENGAGKSTLAAFIRVMFYGFEGERNKKKEDREREQYRPWESKFYGGKIRFEVNGKEYDMFRTFKDKAANDEFMLRDAITNLESKDYPSELGRALFGIDSDSFMRCAFISQNHCETGTTDDINSRIGNLSDDTSDLNNYEGIIGRLTDMINGLTPSRKTGYLYKLDDEITGLKTAINNESTLDKQISNVMADREVEAKLLGRLRESRKKASDLHARVAATADREHYDDICRLVEEAKKGYESVKSSFAFGIPSDQELTAAGGAYTSSLKYDEDAKKMLLSNDERSELSSLTGIFGNSFSLAECKERTNDTFRLDTLNNTIKNSQLTEDEQRQLSELSAFFGRRTSPASENEAVRNNWNETASKRDRLYENKKQLHELEEQKLGLNVNAGPNKGLIAIGLIILVIGIVMICMQKMIPGGVAVGIGAIVAVLGFVLRKQPPREEVERIGTALQRKTADINALDEEIKRAEADITAYLIGYGYSSNADVMSSLSEIYENALEYERLIKKADKAGCENEVAEAQSITAELNAYLKRYNVTLEGSYYKTLESLKERYSDYMALLSKESEYKKLKDKSLDEKAVFESFLRKFGIPVAGADAETVAALRDKKVTVLEAQKAYDNACKRKALFEKEHDISKFIALVPLENMPSLKELSAQIDDLDEQIDLKKIDIDRVTKELDVLMGRADERKENMSLLEEKLEEKAAGKKKYARLLKMKEHLEAAKLTLTAKYSNSIHKRFLHYMELLLGDASSYQLDADSNVTYEAAGMPRNMKTLSAGYKDLVGFCLRLAFVDAMFEDEKPFLILDDPFVNLDKDKTMAGIALINEVAKHYQTLYFTCHESRQ